MSMSPKNRGVKRRNSDDEVKESIKKIKLLLEKEKSEGSLSDSDLQQLFRAQLDEKREKPELKDIGVLSRMAFASISLRDVNILKSLGFLKKVIDILPQEKLGKKFAVKVHITVPENEAVLLLQYLKYINFVMDKIKQIVPKSLKNTDDLAELVVLKKNIEKRISDGMSLEEVVASANMVSHRHATVVEWPTESTSSVDAGSDGMAGQSAVVLKDAPLVTLFQSAIPGSDNLTLALTCLLDCQSSDDRSDAIEVKLATAFNFLEIAIEHTKGDKENILSKYKKQLDDLLRYFRDKCNKMFDDENKESKKEKKIENLIEIQQILMNHKDSIEKTFAFGPIFSQ